MEVHPRIHLDLFVDTTAEQEAEVERLVGLGASKLDWGLYPPEPDFIVLGDPDGNPFCIVDLSQAPSGDHDSSELPDAASANQHRGDQDEHASDGDGGVGSDNAGEKLP